MMLQRPDKIRMRGFAAIGLLQPKSSENVGSVIRAAGCYDAAFVAVQGLRYRKASTDTMKMYKHWPLLQCSDLKNVIPYDCVPVAVELLPVAVPLMTYKHPERAFYVFGPEDGTLGKETISWCRDIVYIPMNGCSNLAATVNVVLYDRLAKQSCTL